MQVTNRYMYTGGPVHVASWSNVASFERIADLNRMVSMGIRSAISSKRASIAELVRLP